MNTDNDKRTQPQSATPASNDPNREARKETRVDPADGSTQQQAGDKDNKDAGADTKPSPQA